MYGDFVIATSVRELQMYIDQFRDPTKKMKVFVLDEDIINQDNYICASILLPPFYALTDLIDNNDKNSFITKYIEYLSGNDVDKFIMLVATAIFKNIDVVFYTNNSDPGMFLSPLLEFIKANYGLIYDEKGNSVDQRFVPFLINKMNMYGYSNNMSFQQPQVNYNIQQQSSISPFERY